MDKLFPNDFRYTLVLDRIAYPIVFAPEGWDKETKLSYKYDQNYRAMLRNFALPLKFVLDGAEVLRIAFQKYGYEAEVQLTVEFLNRTTLQYENMISSDLDFSQYKDDGTRVEITIMEAGTSARVKAYEGVVYEYPTNGPDSVEMILPGVGFTEEGDYIVLPTTEPTGVDDSFLPGVDLVVNGANSGFLALQNVAEERNPVFASSGGWFAQANRQQLVKFHLDLQAAGSRNALSPPQVFRLRIINQSGVTRYEIGTLDVPNIGIVQKSFNVDTEILLASGEKLFFYVGKENAGGGNDNGFAIGEGNLTISYTSVSDPSSCRGLRAFDLFKRIMARVAPGTQVKSSLLSGKWANLIITSGDAIREIPNAKIKISLKDFYKSFAGLDDVGMGKEGAFYVLETGDYFMRGTQIMDIGEVKACEIAIASDYIYNAVKIGYDDGNTDATDGREEYNSGQEWELPVTRIQKQQDWVSKIRADQFGIEQLRVTYNINKEASTDTSSDNDPFWVFTYLDGAVYRPVLGSTYDQVTGLKSPDTAYNLELTPKKNLLRHGAYLRSILDKLDSRYINFGSGDKNTALTTVKNGIRVKENENFTVASLPDKYFIPYLATVTGKLPKGAFKFVDAGMFGYVSFRWNDIQFKGFIVELNIDIARNTEQEITLLLTPDNIIY